MKSPSHSLQADPSVLYPVLLGTVNTGGQAVLEVRDPTLKIITLKKAGNIVSIIRIKYGQPGTT